MPSFYNLDAPRKATNVSINCDLLEQARDLKLNLSATLEQALVEKLREQTRQQWRDENAAAIEAYNTEVEKHGTFGDCVRTF